jgi:hypothetical protein
VMGNEMEIGKLSNGASGLLALVATVLVTAALGAVVVVEDVAGLEAAPAPEGMNATNRPAARANPLPIAPSVVRLFRLKTCSFGLSCSTAYEGNDPQAASYGSFARLHRP